jgi:hypothetical protein
MRYALKSTKAGQPNKRNVRDIIADKTKKLTTPQFIASVLHGSRDVSRSFGDQD